MKIKLLSKLGPVVVIENAEKEISDCLIIKYRNKHYTYAVMTGDDDGVVLLYNEVDMYDFDAAFPGKVGKTS